MPGNVPPVADERQALAGYLAQQRYVVRVAAHGLTEEQARATPTPSQLSVGGIAKHLTAVERNWTDILLERTQAPDEGRMAGHLASFRLTPDETLSSVLDDYGRAAAATDEVIALADLGRPVPVPAGVPWFPSDVDAWSVRWVVLHLIEETARHAGHADIVREALDGAGAFPLMAAVEGWPATPWLEPWAPVTA